MVTARRDEKDREADLQVILLLMEKNGWIGLTISEYGFVVSGRNGIPMIVRVRESGP